MSQAKTRLCDFDQIFELQSLSKTVFIVSQARKLQNQFLQHKKGNDTLPQAIPGGTRLTGVGGALNQILCDLFLLQLASFTVDSDPLQPTEGVDRYTSHVIFVMHIARV